MTVGFGAFWLKFDSTVDRTRKKEYVLSFVALQLRLGTVSRKRWRAEQQREISI